MKMRDLTEKQFVAAMARNGFIKDNNLLYGFRHPDVPEVMFMTMLIQASGYRGALKSALERLKMSQIETAESRKNGRAKAA
ncbi:hypothetical protein [Microvirga roseola]|uniref:hypothetical protein n=1 Tax=Microvirga roseola TaxID=2883126 RepID=UPI001E4DC88F|nr:hypothetical protein [Microvirga roseola]